MTWVTFGLSKPIGNKPKSPAHAPAAFGLTPMKKTGALVRECGHEIALSNQRS